MRATRDPRSVRPGLWVLAALVGGVATWFVVTVAADAAGVPLVTSDEGDPERSRGGRRIVLTPDTEGEPVIEGDPGAPGSIRDSWARAFQPEEGEGLGSGAPPLFAERRAHDPQLDVFHRSFQAEEETPFTPTARRGRVTAVSGLDLPEGASCDVRVLPVVASEFNCVIRVSCGGVLVYPNQDETAGYVSCELDGRTPSRAFDRMPTHADGDPSIAFDLTQGRITVGDRGRESGALDVTIELDPTPVRVM